MNPIGVFQLILSLIFFTLNIYNPYMGLFFGIVSPIFLLFYFRARGKVFIELLVALIIYAVLFKIVAIYYILLVVIPAFYIFKGEKYAEFYAGAPAFLVSLVTIFFFPEIKEFLLRNIEAGVVNYLEILKQTKNSDIIFYVDKIEKNKSYIALLFVYVMPSLAYSYAALISFVNKRIFYRFIKKDVEPFQVPLPLITVFVIGGFLLLVKNPILKFVSYNTLIIFFTLFFLQGIEILEHLLRRFKIPLLIKYIVYFFVIVEPPLTVVLAIIGLFDTWIDFRKLNKGGAGDG